MTTLNAHSSYEIPQDSEALFQEGLTYLRKKNYEKAAQLFQQGAQKNHPKSCYELGFLYFYGNGVPSNREQAQSLWKRAADQAYFGAQVLLAHLKHVEKEKKRHEQKNRRFTAESGCG